MPTATRTIDVTVQHCNPESEKGAANIKTTAGEYINVYEKLGLFEAGKSYRLTQYQNGEYWNLSKYDGSIVPLNGAPQLVAQDVAPPPVGATVPSQSSTPNKVAQVTSVSLVGEMPTEQVLSIELQSLAERVLGAYADIPWSKFDEETVRMLVANAAVWGFAGLQDAKKVVREAYKQEDPADQYEAPRNPASDNHVPAPDLDDEIPF